MKKLLILGLILICLLARAQENQLIVMFYNTENLFDTEDDPEKTDEGFTLGGSASPITRNRRHAGGEV